MIYLEISQGIQLEHADEMIRAAEAVLTSEGKTDNIELTVAIQTDAELQQLNRDFLGIDAPTDVLSFPADEFDPDNQSQYIGDVIISINQAERQALNAGHPLINEIQLLIVHGVLHLLGYDHTDSEQKNKMWRIQTMILEQIGCSINQLPE